ncbi:hypothetical protein TREES_T100003738 [Tupaia chinensis]|uniref:Uncharacterized protein n=1 Tax=Tupaia chinensis TaxID=246437 RepID=L9LCR9_TUPCH|nr:hypothetical protein TREES_T100003738 [Tupaia chinensis]
MEYFLEDEEYEPQKQLICPRGLVHRAVEVMYAPSSVCPSSGSRNTDLGDSCAGLEGQLKAVEQNGTNRLVHRLSL